MFCKKPFEVVDLVMPKEQTINLPITTYEELLIIKGKYEEKENQDSQLIDKLVGELELGKLTPNQVRVALGLKERH